mmetsp:Transcript_54147/g.116946  ORF Transcript_54147/g.116946 Transcript_54147/m.116946 type:complete len:244 (+) Transcript_54147:276-1007(+)
MGLPSLCWPGSRHPYWGRTVRAALTSVPSGVRAWPPRPQACQGSPGTSLPCAMSRQRPTRLRAPLGHRIEETEPGPTSRSAIVATGLPVAPCSHCCWKAQASPRVTLVSGCSRRCGHVRYTWSSNFLGGHRATQVGKLQKSCCQAEPRGWSSGCPASLCSSSRTPCWAASASSAASRRSEHAAQRPPRRMSGRSADRAQSRRRPGAASLPAEPVTLAGILYRGLPCQPCWPGCSECVPPPLSA